MPFEYCVLVRLLPKIASDQRVEAVLLPLADGVTVARKL